MTAYDDDNIFAKILRGEIPSTRVYEDDDTLDASPAQLEAVIRTVQKLAQASKAAFDADGVTIQQFNEAAGGQEVFHLHFHVLPRHEGVSPRAPGQMGDMDAIAAHAEKIRAAL